MKYFDYDKEFDCLTPKDEKWKWYWFPADELWHYYPDGKHNWFNHLSHKIWFTENHFWDLLEYAKQRHPEVDFTKAIWQVAQYFKERHVYENFSYYQRLHELTEEMTVKLPEKDGGE